MLVSVVVVLVQTDGDQWSVLPGVLMMVKMDELAAQVCSECCGESC